MKWFAAAMLLLSAQAQAQDSTFTELRLRLSVLRNPVAGAIADDWRAGTGVQVEVATPLAVGEVGAAIGQLGYEPLSGNPAYRATLFTVAWMSPAVRLARAGVSGGLRLTVYRMDFDDPALVEGLRTEEEMMPSVVVRGQLPLTRRFALFADGSYGVLMLGTRTPMVLVHVGVERALNTPSWIRDILR